MKDTELLQTNNAMVWAKEFVKRKNENKWTLDEIDEGLMVGWFANAMAAQEHVKPVGADSPPSGGSAASGGTHYPHYDGDDAPPGGDAPPGIASRDWATLCRDQVRSRRSATAASRPR